MVINCKWCIVFLFILDVNIIILGKYKNIYQFNYKDYGFSILFFEGIFFECDLDTGANLDFLKNRLSKSL